VAIRALSATPPGAANSNKPLHSRLVESQRYREHARRLLRLGCRQVEIDDAAEVRSDHAIHGNGHDGAVTVTRVAESLVDVQVVPPAKLLLAGVGGFDRPAAAKRLIERRHALLTIEKQVVWLNGFLQ
jgi:hypothetical protein